MAKSALPKQLTEELRNLLATANLLSPSTFIAYHALTPETYDFVYLKYDGDFK